MAAYILEHANDAKDSPITMGRTWSSNERHALHILASHYPDSAGSDRAAIFNHVFNTDLSWQVLRDEYGGHSAGQRNRPNGRATTRSVMWNDNICRDEFGLGGYDQNDAADRATVLRLIQGAIAALGLTTHQGLGAIRMAANRVQAGPDVAARTPVSAGPAPLPAPVPPAPIAPVGIAQPSGAPLILSSTTPYASYAPLFDNLGLRIAGRNGPGPILHINDLPQRGGANWYHAREIVAEGSGFVYCAHPDADYMIRAPSYRDVNVRFPDLDRVKKVIVCVKASCPHCCNQM